MNPKTTPQQKRSAIVAVAFGTIIQVIGQLLIKQGAGHLTETLGRKPTLVETAVGMFTVLPLFAGYALYGVFTLIMVYALQHAELSVLYPIMSLAYVGVVAASVFWLHEPVNVPILLGVAVIMAGIVVLGRGESRRA